MIETKVVGFRHGEKNGDMLTPKGAMQIFESSARFKNLRITTIYHSGANRTKQCANIGQAAMGLWSAPIIEQARFHFKAPFEATLKTEAAWLEEVKTVNDAGGLVSHALAISEYARMVMPLLTEAILKSLEENAGEPFAIFSHGGYINLASPNLPYDIGMADAIIYTICGNKIISAEHIPL